MKQNTLCQQNRAVGIGTQRTVQNPERRREGEKKKETRETSGECQSGGTEGGKQASVQTSRIASKTTMNEWSRQPEDCAHRSTAKRAQRTSLIKAQRTARQSSVHCHSVLLSLSLQSDKDKQLPFAVRFSPRYACLLGRAWNYSHL